MQPVTKGRKGDEAIFAVFAARIAALIRPDLIDQPCVGKVNASLRQSAGALSLIPLKFHRIASFSEQGQGFSTRLMRKREHDVCAQNSFLFFKHEECLK